jgi:MOSC domain-containing protein YiiM
MSQGTVVAICVASRKGEPMASLQEAMAVAGQGLSGDRYARGQGSWSRGQVGRRQVTLINSLFVQGSGFEFGETRRNIATSGVELMDLIGQKFSVGDAMLRGVKYCDPCLRPSVLSSKDIPFRDAFHDRGGLVAEVLSSGLIRIGSPVIPPSKHYG